MALRRPTTARGVVLTAAGGSLGWFGGSLLFGQHSWAERLLTTGLFFAASLAAGLLTRRRSGRGV